MSFFKDGVTIGRYKLHIKCDSSSCITDVFWHWLLEPQPQFCDVMYDIFRFCLHFFFRHKTNRACVLQIKSDYKSKPYNWFLQATFPLQKHVYWSESNSIALMTYLLNKTTVMWIHVSYFPSVSWNSSSFQAHVCLKRNDCLQVFVYRNLNKMSVMLQKKQYPQHHHAIFPRKNRTHVTHCYLTWRVIHTDVNVQSILKQKLALASSATLEMCTVSLSLFLCYNQIQCLVDCERRLNPGSSCFSLFVPWFQIVTGSCLQLKQFLSSWLKFVLQETENQPWLVFWKSDQSLLTGLKSSFQQIYYYSVVESASAWHLLTE